MIRAQIGSSNHSVNGWTLTEAVVVIDWIIDWKKILRTPLHVGGAIAPAEFVAVDGNKLT